VRLLIEKSYLFAGNNLIVRSGLTRIPVRLLIEKSYLFDELHISDLPNLQFGLFFDFHSLSSFLRFYSQNTIILHMQNCFFFPAVQENRVDIFLWETSTTQPLFSAGHLKKVNK